MITLYEFDRQDVVAEEDFFCAWRRGDFLGIRIVGALNDARNPVWRAQIDAHIDACGAPKAAFLHVADAIPAASMAKRLQTANWGRRLSKVIPVAAIYVGADAAVGFTVRTILRVVASSSIELLTDADRARERFTQLFEDYRRTDATT